MRIVLKTQISGTRDGLDWPAPGTEIDLPDYEARDLLRAGNALVPSDEDGVYVARGGVILTDEQLGGAPHARDITAGQPDTNLVRARVLAEKGDDGYRLAREAAKRLGLDEAAEDDQPKVGEVESASIDTTPKKRITKSA